MMRVKNEMQTILAARRNLYFGHVAAGFAIRSGSSGNLQTRIIPLSPREILRNSVETS